MGTNLINAAKDLNAILGLEPEIDTSVPENELLATVKEAALWLLVTDEPKQETIDTLRGVEWKESDFQSLKDTQDPLPAFRKFTIIPDPDDEEVPGKRPRKSKPPKHVKKAKPTEPEPEENSQQQIGFSTDPLLNEEEMEPGGSAKPEENPKGPKPVAEASAYGTAIAILGTQPTMPLHDLYEVMRAKGFDLRKSTGSIKTAHSIFKKVLYLLGKNGYLNISNGKKR